MASRFERNLKFSEPWPGTNCVGCILSLIPENGKMRNASDHIKGLSGPKEYKTFREIIPY